LLRLQSDMATTRRDRLRIERELLEHAQQLRRDALARDINSGDPKRAEAAVIASQNLPQVEAAEKGQLDGAHLSPLQSYKKGLQDDVGDMNDALEGVAVHGLKGLEDGLTAVIMGTKSLKSAFKEMAASIISDLIRIAIEKAIVSAIGGGFGFGFSGGGELPAAADGYVPGFASGGASLMDGFIRGPGSGRSDSILAVLGGKSLIRVSNGESIVTAAATRKFGPLIRAMNDDRFPGFADGMVDTVHMADFSREETRAIRGGRAARDGGVTNHFDLRGAMVDRDVWSEVQRIAADTVDKRTPGIVGQSVIATREAQARRF
jgi:hypothetical protein